MREERCAKSGAVCPRRMNEIFIPACRGDETGGYSLFCFITLFYSSAHSFLSFHHSTCLQSDAMSFSSNFFVCALFIFFFRLLLVEQKDNEISSLVYNVRLLVGLNIL